MRRAGCGPGSEASFIAAREEENIIARAARIQPPGEAVARKRMAERLCRQISRLRRKHRLRASAIRKTHDAKVRFRVLRASIVPPVVPYRQRHAVRRLKKPLARKHSRLRLLIHVVVLPGGGIAPLARDYWYLLARRRVARDQKTDGAQLRRDGFRIALPVGMYGNARPVIQQSGLETGGEEAKVDERAGRADDCGAGIGFLDGFARGEREQNVILDVRRGLPEAGVVRLVIH